MKKITLLAAFVLAFALESNAQSAVTALDPNGAGGFELGDTFAANGWTAGNGSYGSRRWHIGAAQAGFTGTRAAFIGKSDTEIGENSGGRTAHLYHSLTIPADATNIQLKFKYKQEVVAFDAITGEPNDYVIVSLMAGAPVGGTNVTAGSTFTGKFPSTVALPTFTQFTATIPATAAGTTQNLVFTFKSTNLNLAGTLGWGAVDDVEVTYDLPLGTEDFNAKKVSFYPNPVKDVLNLSAVENIDSVSVFNLSGQNLLNKTINANETAIDMSSFSNGTYIVNVISDKNVKTIKVVK